MKSRNTSLVLAVDPGSEHVGWSQARGRNVSINYGITTPYEFYERFEDFRINSVDRVVIERFDMRQFTSESQRTIEVIGVIKWLCDKRRIPYGFVNASSKNKFMGDVVQQELRSHAADAEAVRLWDLAYGQW